VQDPTSALCQVALGLGRPWEVERLDFEPDRHESDIPRSRTHGNRSEHLARS